MSGETTTTITGNLVAAPELRFTPAGHAVANFTVASTPRTFDRAAGGWKDGDPLFMRCNLWRDAAENLAESRLDKGARVIVTGRLRSRSYQTREGDKRTSVEMDVEEVGPSLRWAIASVRKAASRQTASGSPGGAPAAERPARGSDPWQEFGSPPDQPPPF